ncbi:hypothetical protein [Nocardioides montaniterrae]
MKHRVRSAVVSGIAVVLGGTALTAGLGGCALFRSDPDIVAAAKFVPAGATALEFTDRRAMAKRLGVDDISGRDATAEDVKKYVAAYADQDWGGTKLAQYLPAMRTGPFNELDIRWEVAAAWSGRSAWIWRADDKLDLGALGRSLTSNGYRKDVVHGLARYSIDFNAKADPGTQLVGGLYPAYMTDVLIDSDDHLVVGSQSGAALEDVAAVTDDEDKSLAEHRGDFAPIIDRADKAEYAAMAAGGDICQPLSAYGSTPRKPTPAYAALGHPVVRALVATGDPKATTNYLEFSSTADAEADATARKALLATGRELRSGQPFRELGTFTVKQDGKQVTIDADWVDGGSSAVSTQLYGGGPAACLPAS